MNEQPLSIFDVKPADITSFQKPDWGNRTNFFDPKPQDANDKVYRAVIRILPNLKQPQIPVTIIRYYWFGDGQTGFRYNTPSTPNMHPQNPEDMMKPLGWCPVSELFWKLKRSGDAQQEQLAVQKFSMQTNYVCLVQIKADSVHPENAGKIMPYKLPAALYKRIMNALNPTEEDIKMGQIPLDVFHPVKGHDILLKITLKDVNGQLMRDYEICKINENRSSVFIDGQGADLVKYDADAEYRNNVNNAIIKLLEEQPELESEYGYKEADVETKRKVKAILAEYEDVSNIWPEIVIAPQAQAAQQANVANTQSQQPQPQPAQPTQKVVDPFAAASSTSQATADFIAGISGDNDPFAKQ